MLRKVALQLAFYKTDILLHMRAMPVTELCLGELRAN
jgi:hypothetical protein